MAKDSYLPSIGNIIQVRYRDKEYSSRLIDIVDGRFIILGPMEKGTFIPIAKNSKMKIIYIIEEKGRFLFDCVVKERSKDPVYKLEVEKINEIVRIQEREYYRLPLKVPIKKSHSSKREDIDEITEECEADDISGGGLGILTNYKHNVGDVVDLKILDNEIDIDVSGKVLRLDSTKNSNYKYSAGIAFFDMNAEKRDKIIKFIFKQQRKLRKKGLI